MAVERPTPLTDEELLAVLERERTQARDFMTGQLGTERRLAYEYYYGKLFGNEEEGSSQVVSQVVSEVIDAALPDIIKVFAASDAAVQCEPRNEEDVDAAEQATDLCNYVFWTQNNGFLLLYEMVKDALLQKVGVCKYYWDETVKVERESYTGLTMDQLTMLMDDPEVEIVAASPYPDPAAGMPTPPEQAHPSMAGMGQAGGMPASYMQMGVTPPTMQPMPQP